MHANSPGGKVRHPFYKGVLALTRHLYLNFYAGKVIFLQQVCELRIKLS